MRVPDSIAQPFLEEVAEHCEDAQSYHETTKLNRVNIIRLGTRIESIVNNPTIYRQVMRAWKNYSACDTVTLPKPTLGRITVEQVIRARRSHTGSYSEQPIELGQLATILAASYGPTGYRPLPGKPDALTYHRASPSGGALYPLEIYPVVFNVDGLAPGAYHYDVHSHSLHVLRAEPCKEAFLACMGEHETKRTSACVLVITAVMPRTLSKYLFRGYRFMSYDAGALLQSLYLTATAVGVGNTVLGGFCDDEVGDFLEINNVEEQVLILFSLGHSPDAQRRLKDV